MLKDASSFLHCTGLLWQPCWASLMSHMCHCSQSAQTQQSSVIKTLCFGFFCCCCFFFSNPLSTFVSLSSCRSVTRWFAGNFFLFFCYRRSLVDYSFLCNCFKKVVVLLGRRFFRFFLKTTAFTLKGVKSLPET